MHTAPEPAREVPAPAATPTAAGAPAAARTEAARDALRQLVALSAEVAAREVEIQQAHDAAIAQAEKSLQRAKSNFEQRVRSLRDEIEQNAAARIDQANQQFQTEFAELKASDAQRREQVAEEYDRAAGETKQKIQQANWLAESMFEGAQNGLREDSKNAKERHSTQLAAIEEMEQQADARVRQYRQQPPDYLDAPEEPDAQAAPAAEADATDADFTAAREQADRYLADLKSLPLPKLFSGIKPFLIVPVVCAAAAVVTNWIAKGAPSTDAELREMSVDPKIIAYAIGGALVFCGIAGTLLWMGAKSQVRKTYIPLRRSLTTARRAADRAAKRASQQREQARARATRKRIQEIEAVKRQFAPHLARADKNRDSATQVLQADYNRKLERIEIHRDKQLAEVSAWQQQHIDAMQQKHGAELRAAEQKFESATRSAKDQFEVDKASLRNRWNDGLIGIQAGLAQSRTAGPRLHRYDDPAWKDWQPPKAFTSRIRFGELRVNLQQITENYPKTLQLPGTFAVPATLTLPQHASLMIHFDRAGRQQAIATLQTVMFRLLTSLPAGRVRFTLIDPVGLGQNFAGFMHLADHDDALVGGRIWTEAEHIDQRLADLTEHMETVIQKYLRNEFQTIDDYNAQAGELAEPYRFLVVADLPTNFNSETLRRLASIASTGARCGVYTLISRDLRQTISDRGYIDEIESHSINLVPNEDGSFAWNDEVFKQFPLVLDSPPPEDFLTRVMETVGRGAKEAKRVEVPFTSIAPPRDKFWSGSASSELSIPVGRAGATRVQPFKLGRGVAQHALIAGKTGSGKSTLLHALVTNTAMWYSPDEVEFYLVDFKKGVEFKTYATNELPHARAIAVESDREFGLSVLQRIDAELARRGELFRKAGVQDLASYRQSSGQKMPRTLLIIDEFQEFFSEDDKLSQEAATLIDRLVRQGRAFGIHVLLGSQTIGGTSGLSRSTMGQMAVRVALQTSEADSQLILGDNNSAARLLTRPGEAIYNDAGGLVEGNSPFQVAWLPDEQRDDFLRAVREKAKGDGEATTKRDPAIVFEGNAPADITKNRKLLTALSAATASPPASSPPRAWLGDPVAIKDPTAVTFRRQAGANALVIGQHEEAAMALIASSITSLAAQSPSASFYILDGSAADSPLAAVLPRLREALSNDIKLIDYRGTEDAIAELRAELDRRQSTGGANPPPAFLFIYGLQRYRALRKSEDSFSFGSSDEEKKPQPDKQFGDILRDGPPLGIHTFAWCDTAAALERTLDRATLREFDNRILFQMSAADSSNLIDAPTGNKLGPHRALLYSEEQGVTEKFRPYALPSEKWLAHVKTQLANRAR